MIWKLLFVFSLIPIAAALISRWYFGTRILMSRGKRACTVDRIRWETYLGKAAPLEVEEAPAMELGKLLRIIALADWKARDPKRASVRDKARKFGMAVPPLGLIIAVFIIFRMGAYAGLAVFVSAIALSILTAYVSIGTELTVVALMNRRLRESRSFPRRDDEDAVADSATAHVWLEATPPILRFF